MRRLFAVLLLTSFALAAACTVEPSPGGDERPSESTGSTASAEGARPSEEGAAEREPLVLAAAATTPRVRMGLDEARAVLAGADPRWRVVAAPGLPVIGARVVGSARAARRRAARGEDTLAVLRGADVGPGVRPVVVEGVHPLRRPEDYPLTVPGPTPQGVTRLTVVGDLMLARRVPDPAAALAPMASRLARADITVGTLESTLSDDGTPQQGSDSFAADPTVVPLLEAAGFDALSLANNHVGDFEIPALLETVRLLRDSTIEPFGAGEDLRSASRPAVVEHGGRRFGFVGFNAIGETPRATPGTAGALSVRMPPRTGPFVDSDLRHVERIVRRMADRLDVVVVLPHWGTQYTHRPEPVQRSVARRLARAGADLVVGGHPHWVQGLDLVGDTVVAHSLGNFVFDMDFMTETQQGVVLEATFWGSDLKSVDLVPYRMDPGFAPRVVRGAEAEEILADVRSTSTGPFRPR